MKSEDLIPLLQWYHEMGMDVAFLDEPRNRFLAKPSPQIPVIKQSSSKIEDPVMTAKPTITSNHTGHPAYQCRTLEELRQVMREFTGCSLKETAMNLVFADGNPKADVMLVGEAPGADEDRQGKPFVGQSGQLLDKALATVNLDRTKVYISNIIPWRPPGNRPPTTAEIAACQPFIEKHIELISPKILILLGGVAAKTLLATTEGIVKLRGSWRTYHPTPTSPAIKTMATFHPAYLLRSPGQKAYVWRDLLTVERELKKS
jgi:uracil-DNA glycosylase family 4